VQHWLARWDLVLAFVSAQPRHGGNGAVYVLLRIR
jgi:DNA-nicking Smr family endonuclease